MTEIKLKGSFLPVTALKYIEISSIEYLLAGEGPSLKLFSKSEGLKFSVEVLPFGVIHGINLLTYDNIVVVFGQKAFRFVRIVHGNNERKLTIESELVQLVDWILDIRPLQWADRDNYSLVAVTAHSVCILYQMRNGSSSCQFYHCQVNCILYCAALVGNTLDNLAIASGTVFNQILLWNLNKDKSNNLEPVRVSFTAHEGVIYSVEFNEEISRLVSASDDRTIRIWSIPSKWRELEEWEESSCLLVLYGHTARVWRARFLPGGSIVSVGEDATCRVWNTNGSTKSIFRGHRGKCVWSLAVSKSGKTVATGGEDCSIRTHALESSSLGTQFSCKPRPERSDSLQVASPVPRSVFLMGQTPLCLTDEGSLLAGRLKSTAMTFTAIYQDEDFSGYSIGSLSTSNPPILALGNIRGSIVLIKMDVGGRILQSKVVSAHSGKVFSLTWRPLGDSRSLLTSCGPDGEMVCWEVHIPTLVVVKLARLSLPPSKHRWLGTLTLLTSPLESGHRFSVLTGDRRGSIHLYQPTAGGAESLEYPLKTLHGIHGPNGVTDSCLHEGHVYTCGRNGECRKFELSGDGRSVVELLRFKPARGMDWLERMVFMADDMLIVGFHGTELIVHSTLQNRTVVSVTCGGGHRSYAINFIPDITDIQQACVLYIKQAQVCYSEVVVGHSFSSKSVLQEPFVGLEAISMVLLTNFKLVAVGSEDSCICVYRLPGTEDSSSIKPVLTLQGHTSAVKALSSSQHSSEKQLLFSGGGRASLKVWSLQENIWSGKIEASLDRELYLHDPMKKKAKFEPCGAEVAPECRVMSLASFSLVEISPQSSLSHLHHCHYVAAGCSDAVIRQYVYDSTENQFDPLQVIKSNKKCILSMLYFFHDEVVEPCCTDTRTAWRRPLLCYSTTDGHISICDLGPLLWNHVNCQEPGPHLTWPRNCSSQFKVHQSGINDMAVQKCPLTNCYLLVSGGDDNALAITCLKMDAGTHSRDCNISVLWQVTETAAHSSAVTGVAYVGDGLVLSTSIDQRLNVWRLSQDKELGLVCSRMHNIADSSSLLTNSCGSSEGIAIICGVGMQCFKFNPTTISSDHKQN